MSIDGKVDLNLFLPHFAFDVVVVFTTPVFWQQTHYKEASSDISNIHHPATSKITTHTGRIFLLMADICVRQEQLNIFSNK